MAVNDLDWDYLIDNPGKYKLKGSNTLFFISENGSIKLYIPDDQKLEVASEIWRTATFVST